MPLRLITGHANAGKTGAAYARIRSALRGGVSSVFLVPNEADVTRAADELSKEFPLGVRAMTFRRYLDVAWDARGDGRLIVTELQRRVLLAAAARGALVPARGLAHLAERCVVNLAENTGVGWRSARVNPVGPGHDLAQLISGYAGLLDREGLLEQAEAARLLAESPEPTAEVIVAHRFTDFSPSQEAFLLGSSRAGADVTVTLTWEDGFAPTESSGALVDRLLAAGAELQPMTTDEHYGTDEELLEIERGLFAAPTRIRGAGGVRLSTAEGPESEAVRIAEEVRRLVVEETVSPEQIAVVFRDPERHGGVIRQAFSHAGIAADFDIHTPLGNTGFGRALLGVMRFAVTGERAPLLSFLRTPFSGAEPGPLAALEARWRTYDVRSGPRLEREVSRLGDGPAALVHQATGCATGPVDATRAAGWHALASSLFARRYSGGEGVLGEEAEPDALAFAAVSALLTNILALGAGQVSPSELVSLLAEQALVPAIVERPGHVQVTGVTRIRARRFEAIVLGGLNSDEFPAVSAEDMLPGGAVADVVEAFGGSSERRLGAPYERLLFYQTITRARRFVVLSACTADADGETLQVSPLLEEVLDFYRTDGEADIERTHRTLAQVPDATNVSNVRESLVSEVYRGKAETPRARAASRRGRGRRAGLTGVDSLQVVGERTVFSASEIETYLACPYRWFYERAIRPERLDREFGVAEQGTFAHELLAAFYASFAEQTGEPRVSPATTAIADEIAVAVFDELAASVEGRLAIPLELARREALRWVRRVVQADAELLPGFRPVAHEWEFVGDPVDMNGYKLAGRVDRVDVDDDGHAVVTDYKRSSTTKAADVLKLGRVQIPLYMKAVESVLGYEPVGGVYRSLRGGENRGMMRSDIVGGPYLVRNDLLGEVEFASLYAQALELAAGAVEGMRSGVIACEPRTGDACRLCAAAHVCGGGGR